MLIIKMQLLVITYVITNYLLSLIYGTPPQHMARLHNKVGHSKVRHHNEVRTPPQHGTSP